MLRKILITIIAFFSISNNAQTIFPSYYLNNDMEFATPGTIIFGLGGFNNPAELSFQSQPNIYFTWNDKDAGANDFSSWGLFTSVPYLGFGIHNQSYKNFSITDYKLSTAIGSDAFGVGLGYGWSTGDVKYLERSDLFTLGAIFRPANFLSFNLIANLPSRGEREGIIGAGVRPLANYNLSLFGDYTFTDDRIREKIKWSAGAIVEPLDGLRFIGRYYDGKSFNVGVQLGFGSFGITTNAHFNEDAKQSYNTYGIRVGADDRNLLRVFSGKDNYVSMNLQGGVKYQNFKLFDNSRTLFNLLEQLNAIINDNSVSGIAINLSGMNINKEMLWELREKLREIKSHGKKVYIYIDRAGMDEYHFASVADKIILDPMGTISLNGYLMGRTFFKGSLEMLGLGFRELRYFKYKSAVENYARKDFSEADREQRQRLVDENYNLAQREICASRNFTPSYFDELVDSAFLFLPEDAMKLRLVDTLARWSDINEIINNYEKENKSLISANSLEAFKTPNDYWGSKPKIAVIYAIGGTGMDDGIKARNLVKYVEAAMNSGNVKAIVVRVDSPGGDALAADLIADVLHKGKGKKPIIVSQGYVAASGGYWLSMFADTIVAAPNTITGSIGVIGAYIFNKTLKQNLGMSVDHVQKGKFADLGFGATIPLIGISIPDRDFTEEELKMAETGIKTLYKGFVEKVALGRNKPFNEIEKIAQGRVWSGSDGLKNGLVDVLGGLDDAIKIALQKTNLTNSEYEIIEMPEPEWFDLNSFLPSFLRIEQKIIEDPFIRDLKFRLQYNGIPIPLLPQDFIDENMIYEE
ncbi:MAG: S49 family peptidase [Ignavibacteriales bacterium]|nr:S49 family peptidase [Ignavibacteriales bacterium]